MSLYLAYKEIWRNKSRFFLVSLVIALITFLVLFIAALAQGLAAANKEYLEKIDADLLVFQKNVELSTTTSRIGRTTLNDIQRLPGVKDIGPIGFSNATIVMDDSTQLDISLIGVEPDKPGSVPALVGTNLRSLRSYQTVIDDNVAERLDIRVGDTITVRTIQGSDEKFYQISVIGISDGRQYFFLPSIFIPLDTWDKIRPQEGSQTRQTETISNVVAVSLQDPSSWQNMIDIIETSIPDVEVVDLKTAYESTPGYQAQQSTLNTQQIFTFLIGTLVIGGFFQIQTLQKIPQIGVLKAIGATNPSVGLVVIIQILLITFIGVFLGVVVTLVLSLVLPPGIPFNFSGQSAILAVLALFFIGPLGGLVSVRMALKVEPLAALGM